MKKALKFILCAVFVVSGSLFLGSCSSADEQFRAGLEEEIQKMNNESHDYEDGVRLGHASLVGNTIKYEMEFAPELGLTASDMTGDIIAEMKNGIVSEMNNSTDDDIEAVRTALRDYNYTIQYDFTCGSEKLCTISINAGDVK